MWDNVHLVLDTVLAIITFLLVLRQDLHRFLLWRSPMQRTWEDVLGQRVLFVELEGGKWQWKAGDLDVRQDPTVRFPSLSAARLACAAMIHAFFVMEEVTSEPVRPSTSSFADDPTVGEAGPFPPPHGSGGGN